MGGAAAGKRLSVAFDFLLGCAVGIPCMQTGLEGAEEVAADIVQNLSFDATWTINARGIHV